ncbi:MAG: hypothetical protein O6952_04455 [Planctomycetota bacterium]|nr:hypothetical protein [Planctomycetota bacterium]
MSELMITCVIMFCIYVIFAGVMLKGRKIEADAPNCLERLERLGKRLKEKGVTATEVGDAWASANLGEALPDETGDELLCPEVAAAYRLAVRGGEWKICCPDPDNHLGVGDTGSCRAVEGWEQSAPGPDGEIELSNWEVQVGPEGDLTISRNRGWMVTVAYVLGALAALYCVVFPYLILNEGSDAKKPLYHKVLIYLAMLLLLVLVCYLVLGAIFLPWFYSPAIEFTSDGQIQAEGSSGPITLWEETVEKGSVLAIAHGSDDSHSRVMIHFRDDEGEIQTWQIRLEKDDDAPGLASMIRTRLFR